MSEELVCIHGGRRQGRSLGNEAAMRAALGDGKRVITWLNGVFFEVGLVDNVITYTPHPAKPDGVTAEDERVITDRTFTRR
jgi:hypothetical protein